MQIANFGKIKRTIGYCGVMSECAWAVSLALYRSYMGYIKKKEKLDGN